MAHLVEARHEETEIRPVHVMDVAQMLTDPISMPTLSCTLALLPIGVDNHENVLQAANALRDLCDANRTALAPHISAFGELHAGLVGVPDTEKAKVLQSIASVIQALPPAEEIPPVEAIVAPVVARLFQALQSSSQLPDESRALAFQQLQTLTGVAKGLTRAAELGGLDDPPALEETERMQRARDDSRMLRVREDMVNALRGTVELWSTDAGISDALSDLFKSITALAADSPAHLSNRRDSSWRAEAGGAREAGAQGSQYHRTRTRVKWHHLSSSTIDIAGATHTCRRSRRDTCSLAPANLCRVVPDLRYELIL
ncbi:hypothetical protein FA95DRAFT_399217 [Auriscalpium vulgare]|uniref:Uncharacterized protein n=1 Tax=Auriscalpium vulgare TaxID=40419 RepID=A0ACB8RIE4_9AGAM|nr:hypothetical protein FA95DRAFT_399217 [Auriscalpium vulgare]